LDGFRLVGKSGCGSAAAGYGSHRTVTDADKNYRMDGLILLTGVFCAIASAVHFASIVTVIARLRKDDRPVSLPNETDGVSILRPVCGIENFIEDTLRATFRIEYPRFEIVFCVADAGDPIVPIVRGLIAEHPLIEAKLLIGNSEISANPKLNNLVKGWHAARYNWVLMVDSNVLMPTDHIQRMLSAWRPGAGLVCSPAIGCAPQSVWAELECAFLNTYQVRWQCFADSIGLGFAQGKAMLWRRELLDRAGGIEVLASEMAEDAAATKAIRRLGLRVRVVTEPFMQPLGHRTATEIWRRQVRWARLRRDTFTLFFIPEILAGAVPPLAAAAVWASAVGWPVIDTILPLGIAWYAAEAILACTAGWPFSWRSIAIWTIRDVLLTPLWIAAWIGNDFEWRGNAMTIADQGQAV
jgi:ceramide glucosyltransferase